MDSLFKLLARENKLILELKDKIAPYAEVDGKTIDDLFGFDLGYTITFKEL